MNYVTSTELSAMDTVTHKDESHLLQTFSSQRDHNLLTQTEQTEIVMCKESTNSDLVEYQYHRRGQILNTDEFDSSSHTQTETTQRDIQVS